MYKDYMIMMMMVVEVNQGYKVSKIVLLMLYVIDGLSIHSKVLNRVSLIGVNRVHYYP